jgi:branched-subunit amino acid aminotransferase/4-amino-4-deoxychorismate lyase
MVLAVLYLETITQRDQRIAFLEAHLANLTQSIGQLALKPSEEKAKKKGWWQFWKE